VRWYHGTTTKFWPRIRSRGLVHVLENSIWTWHPDYAIYPSLRPYSGVYITSNISVAYHAALQATDAHGGSPMLVIGELNTYATDSVVLDEDDFVSPLEHAGFPGTILGDERAIVDNWVSDYIEYDGLSDTELHDVYEGALRLLRAEYKFRENPESRELEREYRDALDSILRKIRVYLGDYKSLRVVSGKIGYSGDPHIVSVVSVDVDPVTGDTWGILLYGDKMIAEQTMLEVESAAFIGQYRGIRTKEDKMVRVKAHRPASPLQVLRDMVSSVGRVVSFRSSVDGGVALVRTPDGQAYEVEIRPAEYAKSTIIKEHYTKKKSSTRKAGYLYSQGFQDPELPGTRAATKLVLDAILSDMELYDMVADMVSATLEETDWDFSRTIPKLAHRLAEFVKDVFYLPGDARVDYRELASRILRFLVHDVH